MDFENMKNGHEQSLPIAQKLYDIVNVLSPLKTVLFKSHQNKSLAILIAQHINVQSDQLSDIANIDACLKQKNNSVESGQILERIRENTNNIQEKCQAFVQSGYANEYTNNLSYCKNIEVIINLLLKNYDQLIILDAKVKKYRMYLDINCAEKCKLLDEFYSELEKEKKNFEKEDHYEKFVMRNIEHDLGFIIWQEYFQDYASSFNNEKQFQIQSDNLTDLLNKFQKIGEEDVDYASIIGDNGISEPSRLIEFINYIWLNPYMREQQREKCTNSQNFPLKILNLKVNQLPSEFPSFSSGQIFSIGQEGLINKSKKDSQEKKCIVRVGRALQKAEKYQHLLDIEFDLRDTFVSRDQFMVEYRPNKGLYSITCRSSNNDTCLVLNAYRPQRVIQGMNICLRNKILFQVRLCPQGQQDHKDVAKEIKEITEKSNFFDSKQISDKNDQKKYLNQNQQIKQVLTDKTEQQDLIKSEVSTYDPTKKEQFDNGVQAMTEIRNPRGLGERTGDTSVNQNQNQTQRQQNQNQNQNQNNNNQNSNQPQANISERKLLVQRENEIKALKQKKNSDKFTVDQSQCLKIKVVSVNNGDLQFPSEGLEFAVVRSPYVVQMINNEYAAKQQIDQDPSFVNEFPIQTTLPNTTDNYFIFSYNNQKQFWEIAALEKANVTISLKVNKDSINVPRNDVYLQQNDIIQVIGTRFKVELITQEQYLEQQQYVNEQQNM